jgi:predicted ABC-type ATPase
MEKNLYIIAGHNGAGKTTFLREFIRDKDIKYIEVDEIVKDISIDNFSLLSIRAGKIALQRMDKFKKENVSFVIETTLSGLMWKKIISYR